MRARILGIAEDRPHAVDRDSGVADVETVRRAGRHLRDDHDAGPDLAGDILDRAHHLGNQRRGRARGRLTLARDRDARVVDDRA